MEIKAELKYVRIAPRKVRSVAHLIDGMNVADAQFQLRRMSRRPAEPILKLLKSAVANAAHNFDIKESAGLYIKRIVVDEGPVLKRMMPRAFGRGALIKKRMSHVRLVLDAREAVTPRKQKVKKEGPVVRDVVADDIGHDQSEIRQKKEAVGLPAKSRKTSDFVRRVFRRKAI